MAIAYPQQTQLPALELIGGAGPDGLQGGSLAELIDGLGGDDILHGGNGNDVIIIGPGQELRRVRARCGGV